MTEQVDVPVEGELSDEQIATAFPGQDVAHIRSMMGTSEGEGVAAAPSADEAESTEAEASVEYPEYIPEKYRNGSVEEAHAAMAKGYKNLEGRLGSQQAAPEAADEADEAEGTDDEAPAAKTSLADVEAAYVANGNTIPEDLYAQYEAQGMPRETLDAYIVGQRMIADQMVTAVHAEVGGSDAYSDHVKWAEANWGEDEVAAYDTIVTSGDKAAAMVAVRGLAAAYKAATGTAPSLVTGQGNAAPSGNSFASQAEMTAAMKDPRYKTDPAFRKSVEERVGISDIW